MLFLFLTKKSIDKLEVEEEESDESSKNDSIVNQKVKFFSDLDPIVILPITTAFTILLLGLGVLYIQFTNPIVDFDVDFYMALDSVRGAGGDALNVDTVMGLPKLSPAEQLVGVLFGP